MSTGSKLSLHEGSENEFIIEENLDTKDMGHFLEIWLFYVLM